MSARLTPTHSRLESTVTSSARTENREAYCASTATIGRATSTPRAAPTPHSSRLSTSSVRRRAPAVAPSEARMASSPSRRTERARMRFATFEHAMTNTSAEAARRIRSTVLAGEVISSRSRLASIWKSALRGYASGCALRMSRCTARNSLRAASRSVPGASRPKSSVIRCTRPCTIVASRWCGLVTMLAMISVCEGYGTDGSTMPTIVAERSPSRMTLPIAFGSLASALLQNRWVSTTAPAACGPSSDMLRSRPRTGRRPITSKYDPPTTPARTTRGSPSPTSVKSSVEKSPKVVQRPDARAQVVDLRHRERGVVGADALGALADVDQAVFVLVHQRTKQHAADDAEDGGVGADAEGQCDDDRQSQALDPGQRPDGEFEVGEDAHRGLLRV